MTTGSDDFPLHQALPVPFVDADALEYSHGHERSAAAESLIKREFGDFGQLRIDANRVALGERTLVDLEQPDGGDADAVLTQPWPLNRSALSPLRDTAEYDPMATEQKSLTLAAVFRLRAINDGEDLRIAVQSPLLRSQAAVVRQLLSALDNCSAKHFEIDLNLCTDMSITGLGILLLVQKNLAVDSQHIAIINGKPAIMQLLKWAGMDKYFSLQ